MALRSALVRPFSRERNRELPMRRSSITGERQPGRYTRGQVEADAVTGGDDVTPTCPPPSNMMYSWGACPFTRKSGWEMKEVGNHDSRFCKDGPCWYRLWSRGASVSVVAGVSL